MLVVSTILSLSLLCRSGSSEKIEIQCSDPQPQLKSCVEFVMRKYFFKTEQLTFIGSNDKDDSLLEYIHSLKILSISVRNVTQRTWQSNKSYMIVAKNVYQFEGSAEMITRENSWNPYARYLIVIDSLQHSNLVQILNILLRLRIYNVVVVNGTESAEMFTYNPYDDYACGNYYTRVIEFGKCSNISVDLYPIKHKTGLRNCVLTVASAHWPPYCIDPSKSTDNPYVFGVEQYVFDIMSRVEGFKYKFVYNYDPEMFSTVSESQNGELVSGPMAMLQMNMTDVMLGGLVLTQSKARTFLYVNGHFDQIEEIRLIVKKASTTPLWKNFFIEFSPLVWTLILVVLVLYTIILLMLLRAQDKGHIILVLLDNLLLHGAKMNTRQSVKAVLILWVWFTYLLNCFYQSSLVSITMKPSTEYQINDEETMNAHNLKPCISKVMQKVMEHEESTIAFENSTNGSCEKFISTLMTVSKSKDMYTATLYTCYLYHIQQFYDEYGESLVHSFPKPYTKVIYAFYFHKGFPLGENLHRLAIRIRETGLTEKCLNYHYALRAMKFKFHTRGFQRRFSIPWYVYIVGIIISSLTFFIEIMSIQA